MKPSQVQEHLGPVQMLLAAATVDGMPKAVRAAPSDVAGCHASKTTPARPVLLQTEIAPPSQDRWSLLSSAAVISFLAHAAVLVWLWTEPASQPGLAGQEIEAIGVEIIDAAALESVSSQRAPDAIGGAASDFTETGSEAPATQQQVTAASLVPERTEVAPAPAATLKAEPDPVAEPDIAVAKVVDDTMERPPIEVSRTKAPPEPAPPKQPDMEEGRDKTLQAEQQAAVAGGASSRATEASTASAAAASVSPGQIARFAMLVRASLGRARPRHLGARGRVHVAFVLSDAGALLSAEITQSSGHFRLDEGAIQAVRATPFPRPPSGATDAQRSFVVPFDFK